MPNMALAFGALLGGAIVIDYGVKNARAALGGTSAPSRPALPAGSSSTAVGKVTRSDLLSLAGQHQWNSSEITDWFNVITKESGGNPQAVNSSSGAAGIAQFIGGYGEYAQYGGNADTVTGQLTAMANYIKQRYGTPSAAWAHEQTYGWY